MSLGLGGVFQLMKKVTVRTILRFYSLRKWGHSWQIGPSSLTASTSDVRALVVPIPGGLHPEASAHQGLSSETRTFCFCVIDFPSIVPLAVTTWIPGDVNLW